MRNIVMWPGRFYKNFLHYHINGTIIWGGGGKLNLNCVLLFSLQRSYKTFLILSRFQRDMTKYVYWSSCKVQITPVRL